jgi:hypothetical protein
MDGTNVRQGVAFCSRIRDHHGVQQPDPRNRCEFCDELVWVDPSWRMRHLVCVKCMSLTPTEWIDAD